MSEEDEIKSLTKAIMDVTEKPFILVIVEEKMTVGPEGLNDIKSIRLVTNFVSKGGDIADVIQTLSGIVKHAENEDDELF